MTPSITLSAPVFKGSVNRWECDENDHLNVRFYAQKMHQTLEAGLRDLELVSKQELASVCRKITAQHMRYIAEARVAAPISGYFGLLTVGETSFAALTELRNTATNEVMASYVHEINHTLSKPDLSTIALPGNAGSRGIESKATPFANLSIQEAHDKGFHTVGRGTVQADEVCPEGYLLPALYMGKSSDSMPNLWAKFEQEQFEQGPFKQGMEGRVRGDGITGGAVLEYRMNYYSKLMLGDRFEMVSGFEKLGAKTQHMLHLIFNLESGDCVIACQAIGISMDLVARKSIEIPPQKRSAMEKLLVSI